ncbi:MAG TPA: DNA repair protein RecO, partial [Armatimonadota bacterium]
AVAKGSRRPTSRFASATEAFSYAKAVLAVGQNLDVLTQVEVKTAFPGLRTDLFRMAIASHLVETVDLLLEERQPNPRLFDLTLSALYVSEKGRNPEAALQAFLIQAAQELGYGSEWHRCLRCGTQASGEGIGYSVSQGGVVCRACRPAVKDASRLGEGVLARARHLSGLSLPDAGGLPDDPGAAGPLHRLLRHHLESRAEHPLRSAEFLESLALKRRTEARDAAE